MEFQKLSDQEEAVGRAIVRAAYNVHLTLGPGLLEKIYEICLVHELNRVGLSAARQTNRDEEDYSVGPRGHQDTCEKQKHFTLMRFKA